MMKFQPCYLKLYESGELDERVEKLYSVLESCELCPRKCKINRLEGAQGYCKSGKELMISSYSPHFGEEEPLVGISRLPIADVFRVSHTGGSGTIFLTSCNLLCLYCQNYEISHLGQGAESSIDRISGIMLHLQNKGCHNINFVTPTHFTPQLVKSIKVAVGKGLRLPIVWNCGGYENVEIIKLLDGIVDIYMPDIKYSGSEPAKKYSNTPDYFDRCKEAAKEMHRQVGDLKLDERGIAYRGLLIRHLILPNDLAGSEAILRFISEVISTNSYINIMSQYRPEGRAYQYKELNCYPTKDEFYRVIDTAKDIGLTRGFQRKHMERL